MEKQLLYKIADLFFFVFHVAPIIFNLFGWIPASTRKWNLSTLGATAFWWFILGIFHGFGYCFLTDWHWQVRRQLGYSTDSNSYIHFLLAELTGISIREGVVDAFTVILFFAAFVISVVVNLRGRREV